MPLIQKLLDGFWWLRKWVISCLAYISLRVYGSEVSFQSIWLEKFPSKTNANLNLDKAKDLPGLLSVAKECLKVAESRRAVVTDKCKPLLTLSSLLLGLVGVLLPTAFAFDALWMRMLFFASALALLNTVALLLVLFAVGASSVISLDQDEVALEKDDLQKNLINSNLQCQADMDQRTDYLVEVYKAARFYFLSAFTVVVILFAISFFSQSTGDQTERVIRELRSDPHLIELLRGPKGEIGKDGDHGKDGTVNVNEIIEQLIRELRIEETFSTQTQEDCQCRGS